MYNDANLTVIESIAELSAKTPPNLSKNALILTNNEVINGNKHTINSKKHKSGLTKTLNLDISTDVKESYEMDDAIIALINKKSEPLTLNEAKKKNILTLKMKIY